MGCSVDGCIFTLTRVTRGLCSTHYQRGLIEGTLDRLPIKTLAERLASGLTAMPNGCLEWIGPFSRGGYARIWSHGKQFGCHRVAWELVNGPIPEGLHVLHHCDNPPCCETAPSEEYPEGHLFLGTPAENTADKVAKGRCFNQRKTHCPQGHLYDETNTYVPREGVRQCRACKAESKRNRRAA